MLDIEAILRVPEGSGGFHRTAEGVYDFLEHNPDHGQHVEHYRLDAEAFDYFAAPEDAATRHESLRLHQRLLGHLPEEARTVLDVGCGNAWVAEALLGNGRSVISFDVAPRNTAGALRRYPHPDHFAVTGDAFDLPFRDASVDAVVSSEVMEHLPDVPLYLKNLLRVVRPGGRIVLSTPYDEKIQYSLCVHCNHPTPLHAHLHSFTEASIAELLAAFPGVTYRTETQANKALVLLQTHRLLAPLPFAAWRAVDRIANRLLPKPARLIAVIDKPAQDTSQ